jgi:hypothetical protein
MPVFWTDGQWQTETRLSIDLSDSESDSPSELLSDSVRVIPGGVPEEDEDASSDGGEDGEDEARNTSFF